MSLEQQPELRELDGDVGGIRKPNLWLWGGLTAAAMLALMYSR
jgi:hypothetical protein